MRQITFACQPSFEKFARSSRREKLLQTMDYVVPRSELEALIAPYYPKAGNGRQLVGLSDSARTCCHRCLRRSNA
jgi:IS5 family transposase